MSNENGDALKKYREEQLKKMIAQMNVFSQHKKVMAETTKPKRRSKQFKTKIMKKG